MSSIIDQIKSRFKSGSMNLKLIMVNVGVFVTLLIIAIIGTGMIVEGIKICEKNNPQILVIVFYFLHEGAHVKTDINNDLLPALENSNIKKTYITKHLGADEKMIELIIVGNSCCDSTGIYGISNPTRNTGAGRLVWLGSLRGR